MKNKKELLTANLLHVYYITALVQNIYIYAVKSSFSFYIYIFFWHRHTAYVQKAMCVCQSWPSCLRRWSLYCILWKLKVLYTCIFILINLCMYNGLQIYNYTCNPYQCKLCIYMYYL